MIDPKNAPAGNPNSPRFFDTLYGSNRWEIDGNAVPFPYEDDGKKQFYRSIASLSFFNGSGRILDVGCGLAGVFSLLEGKESYELYGIDYSAVAIRLAKSRIPGGHFIVGDVHRIPFADRFFDRIISTETLEHVDDPGIVVGEMYRLLRRGGILLVTVPEKDHDLPPEGWPLGVSMHINKFDIDSLSRIFREKGFEVRITQLCGKEIFLVASRP